MVISDRWEINTSRRILGIDNFEGLWTVGILLYVAGVGFACYFIICVRVCVFCFVLLIPLYFDGRRRFGVFIMMSTMYFNGDVKLYPIVLSYL